MTITPRARSTGFTMTTSTAAWSYLADYPAGMQARDILVANVWCDHGAGGGSNAAAVLTTPTGWTALRYQGAAVANEGDQIFANFWRKWDGVSTSVAFQISARGGSSLNAFAASIITSYYEPSISASLSILRHGVDTTGPVAVDIFETTLPSLSPTSAGIFMMIAEAQGTNIQSTWTSTFLPFGFDIVKHIGADGTTVANGFSIYLYELVFDSSFGVGTRAVGGGPRPVGFDALISAFLASSTNISTYVPKVISMIPV